MKYIITAKNIQDNSSVTDPLKRTEIATELISTRMKALQLLSSGEICDTDTIITRQDRFCLYEDIFKNIWNTESFHCPGPDPRINPEDIIDLVSEINDGSIDSSGNFCEKFFPWPDQLFNISLCNLKDYQKPFVCILSRQMDNHAEKNIDSAYILNLATEILKKTNLDVFIFGDRYSDFESIHERIKVVYTLKGWCSLLSSENCRLVISPCSGGVYPLFFVGNEKSHLLIIDENSYCIEHQNSPSFYNPCVNFKNVKVEEFYYLPKERYLADYIKEEYGY